MPSRSARLLLSLFVLILVTPALFAHDVTLTGTQSFASIDGSASDHDGAANGVFTVNDGNLVVSGVVNCNDDGPGGNSACAMAFAVSGNMTVSAGGALYAENRTGAGSGAAITLTVGGDLALSGNAVISSASVSNAGNSNGGAINATVAGAVSVGAGSSISSASPGGTAGSISLAAGGVVTIDGNVLAGPSRTVAATRLTGVVLTGGSGNQNGGQISVTSTSFAEPAVLIGPAANVVSQGENNVGSITLDGCGVEVRGLVASISRSATAVVTIRSGKSAVVDGRDLGAAGVRMGRVRADSTTGTAVTNRVDVFVADSAAIHGPAAGLFAVTSNTGSNDPKGEGGSVRVIALGGTASASGNAVDAGGSNTGNGGGSIAIHAAGDALLNTASLRAAGDSTSNNNNRDGGSIAVRSYSGNVIWTNGSGDVRPLGSASSIPLADQGSIVLTACGTVNTTGSTFPVNGTATSVHPQTATGVCSPAAPSLPAGTPALVACNTPPVANDAAATTNEDNTVTITLSGTDADGDTLTFSVVSGPSNGVLGPIVPTGPTSATVNYTPNANYNGADSFVYQANDGNGGTDNATVSITVNAVNDAPSFLAGPTVTVLEDAGPQTYANWASSISAGPADESGQTVTFTVTNDNPALFSVQPAVSSNGTLTFTAAADAFGSANITVTAQDNGGTANGGVDTSAPQTSKITVTAVNDAPSFTKGANQTSSEDAGPQVVAGWATAISAGPASEAGQTVTFVTSNDNTSLFSAQPAVSSNGTLTYIAAANASGTATVTIYAQDNGGTANGGDDTSASDTFTITITSVNDTPSFTRGGDVSVLEDSAPYSAQWATAISAGPADESGQTLTFNVSATNPSLFTAGPSISSTGVLTFTLAANASGTSTVTVTLSDNGGGADTSVPQTFTINVAAVNDAPSFVAGGDVTVNEDSGPYSAPWATGISAGPNEGTQTVAFNVSATNTSLFLVQPSISPSGVLTFTPALNASGSSTVTVTLSDNGGTANGGVNTSGSQTFTINVTAINDGPTAGNDAWDTFGNTEIRVDLPAGVTPHVSDTTPSGNGVRHNDTDPEGDPIVITGIVGCGDAVAPFDCTLPGGANVSMLANGSFSYTPAPGATSGSFQYTMTDVPSAGAPATSTGTVTFTIYDMIWYVNGSAAPGGNGTSNAPFNNFSPLNSGSDVDDVGQTIFVHTSSVIGGISLEAGQKLYGQGVGLTKPNNLNGNGSPVVLAPAGPNPVVTAATDVVSVLGVTGVEIAGLTLNSAGANGIDITSMPLGAPFGVSIYNNLVSGASAEGIDVNAGAAGSAVSINNTSIVSASNGLNVSSVGSVSVSYTNGTILSTGGSGIVMGGNVTVTGLANVTIDGNTAADGININGATFDAIAGGSFNTVNSGAITVGSSGNPVGGAGMTLSNVSGDLAAGALNVHATTTGVIVSGSGLYTGAAGMRIGSTAGAISAPAGVGLSVTDSSIALTFTSINSTGGVNGIVLNNTGSTGGLTVSGNGAANSGGLIQNTSGDAVLLSSTSGVVLTDMRILTSGQSHIDATNVNGLTLTRVSTDMSTDHGIRGNGVRNLMINGGVYDRGGAGSSSSGVHGVLITDLLGNSSVTGATFRRSNTIQFRVNNVTATNAAPGAPDVLTVSGTTFDTHTSSFAGDHLSVSSSGAGNLRLVTNAVSGINSFTGAGNAIQATADSGAALDLSSTGVLSNNNTGGYNVAGTTGAKITFSIFDNKTANGTGIANSGTIGINVVSIGGAVMSGTVSNNTVSNAAGTGIQTLVEGNGSLVVAVNGNAINGNFSSFGLRGQARLGSGLLSLNANNNVISGTNSSALSGVSIESGASGSGHTNTVCLNMANNTSTLSNGAEGYRLRQRAGTTFNLQNFVGNGASTTDVANWVNVTKSNTGTTNIIIASSFSAAPGACATP